MLQAVSCWAMLVPSVVFPSCCHKTSVQQTTNFRSCVGEEVYAESPLLEHIEPLLLKVARTGTALLGSVSRSVRQIPGIN